MQKKSRKGKKNKTKNTKKTDEEGEGKGKSCPAENKQHGHPRTKLTDFLKRETVRRDRQQRRVVYSTRKGNNSDNKAKILDQHTLTHEQGPFLCWFSFFLLVSFFLSVSVCVLQV